MKVEEHGVAAPLLNGRNLTNSGTFRAYCFKYLKAHPGIHKQGNDLSYSSTCTNGERTSD